MTTTDHDQRRGDPDAGSDPARQASQDEMEDPQAAEAHNAAAHAAREAAARAVMHPDWHDTDWRYYFGAWGG
jgi:hypothetical protein